MVGERNPFKEFKRRSVILAEFQPCASVGTPDISHFELVRRPLLVNAPKFDREGMPCGVKGVSEFGIKTHWTGAGGGSDTATARGVLNALAELKALGAKGVCGAALTMLREVKEDEPEGFII